MQMVSIGSHTPITLNVLIARKSIKLVGEALKLNYTPSKKFMSGVKHTQRNMDVRRLESSMLSIGKQRRNRNEQMDSRR